MTVWHCQLILAPPTLLGTTHWPIELHEVILASLNWRSGQGPVSAWAQSLACELHDAGTQFARQSETIRDNPTWRGLAIAATRCRGCPSPPELWKSQLCAPATPPKPRSQVAPPSPSHLRPWKSQFRATRTLQNQGLGWQPSSPLPPPPETLEIATSCTPNPPKSMSQVAPFPPLRHLRPWKSQSCDPNPPKPGSWVTAPSPAT